MQLRAAAGIYGRVIILTPLILVFLTFADSAFACPGHTNGAAYRTRVKTKTMSNMPTTVISYRAPATYKRCGNNLYDTRGARYVGNGYHSGARYVAARNNSGYYRTAQTRYIAVRNADRYDEPRYVAVRRQPVYVDRDVRYVAVRRAEPRVRYVAVRDIDHDDDDVRYVAVRRSVPRTKYVAVRQVEIDDDDDVRYVSERTYAPRTRQIVVRDDDEYSHSTKQVVLSNEIDDDDMRYIADRRTDYVDHDDSDYYDSDAHMSTRTVSYAPSRYMNDDIDRWAYLDGGNANYVAANNFDDACMMNQVAVSTPREVVSTRTVSYVPVDEVEDYSAYMMTEDVDPAPVIRYVAVDEDDDVGSGMVSYSPVNYAQEVDTETVSFAPIDEVEEVDAETVSYMPADDMHSETVSYVPADDMHDSTVSYVPVNDIYTSYTDADATPLTVSSVEQTYVADDSTFLIEDSNVALTNTQQIAGNYGYRDGFEDGRDAALEADEYHPENSGDFQKATEGYEDDYGDKDVYKNAYRSTYLDGYQAGFNSATGTS